MQRLDGTGRTRAYARPSSTTRHSIPTVAQHEQHMHYLVVHVSVLHVAMLHAVLYITSDVATASIVVHRHSRCTSERCTSAVSV